MLEHMVFRMGSFFGWDTIEVIKTNVTYTIKNQKTQRDDWQIVENVDLTDWNTKLESVHIDKWDKSYIDLGVLDGTQWSLEYKFEGERSKDIFGNNAFPDNFLEFIQALSVLYKIIGVPGFWEDDEEE